MHVDSVSVRRRSALNSPRTRGRCWPVGAWQRHKYLGLLIHLLHGGVPRGFQPSIQFGATLNEIYLWRSVASPGRDVFLGCLDGGPTNVKTLDVQEHPKEDIFIPQFMNLYEKVYALVEAHEYDMP